MKRYYRFVIILFAVAIMAVGSDYLVRRGPAHDATAVKRFA